jgi:hypothetical protein
MENSQIMRYTLIAAATVGVAAVLIPSAQAVWVDNSQCAPQHGYHNQAPLQRASHYLKSGYHRNQDWPWPYFCADRAAVREPFCIMVNNGWRRQNLMGPHHFNDETSQLTKAGELRIQWIMTQAPASYRSIFVERSIDPGVTEQRVATVRDYAAQLAAGGPSPQVFDTHLISEGRPAAVVDATNVRFQESTPPPVLMPKISTVGTP